MNSSVDWSTNSIEAQVAVEATREAPAQTELGPACAGSFRPWDVTAHEFVGRLVDRFNKGDITGKAKREAPDRAEPHPT